VTLTRGGSDGPGGTIIRSVITGNLADDDGGGVYARRGGIQVDASIVSGSCLRTGCAGGGGAPDRPSTLSDRVEDQAKSSSTANTGGRQFATKRRTSWSCKTGSS